MAATPAGVEAGGIGAGSLGRRVRLGQPPIITSVAEGRVVLDPRTLPDAAYDDVGSALLRAIAV